MVILGAWLLIAGYWVVYDGLRKWTGFSASGPQVSPSGDTTVSLPGGTKLKVANDCSPHPGDTKLAGGLIWRPLGGGAWGEINGQLVGPC